MQAAGGDLILNDFVQPGPTNLSFSGFTGLVIPQKRYFQYRAIMESNDTGSACNYGMGATWCSPELKAISVGATCN